MPAETSRDEEKEDEFLDAVSPPFDEAFSPVAEPALPVDEKVEEPLLSLDEAVARIPDELRNRMEDLLRAEFREVQRWTPPKG